MTFEEQFEIARKLYPGKKVGHEREWTNFLNRSTKPKQNQIKFVVKDIIPILEPTIEYLIRYHKWCNEQNKWCPEYCSFSVWINQGRWEVQYPEFPDSQQKPDLSEEQKLENKNLRDKLKRGIK